MLGTFVPWLVWGLLVTAAYRDLRLLRIVLVMCSVIHTYMYVVSVVHDVINRVACVIASGGNWLWDSLRTWICRAGSLGQSSPTLPLGPYIPGYMPGYVRTRWLELTGLWFTCARALPCVQMILVVFSQANAQKLSHQWH
jgi:hypothetical protein